MIVNVIIFQRDDGSIGITTPSEQSNINDVADMSTPSGLPYWIVDYDTIPSDRSNRDAWELDDSQGEPDGYGKAGEVLEDDQD